MAMKADAIMAVWNDVAPASEAEFNEWYIRDHLPDRVSLPGFRRGRRWISVGDGPRYFTFYELDDVAVMHSPVYLDRHENPTDWTRQMMPAFIGMNRSICRVTAKRHRGDGGVAGVVRLKPGRAGAGSLRGWVAETVLPALMQAPGILAACLWELDAEASRMPDTAETRLRGARDAVVDWVLLAEASRLEELDALARVVDPSAAGSAGAAAAGPVERYRLLCSLDHEQAGGAAP